MARSLFFAIAGIAILCACGRHSGATEQNNAAASATPLLASPMLTWPTYSALNYKSDHSGKLTPMETARIAKTLALVEPCKRKYLRYAFPSNPDVMPFALMLYRNDVSAENVIGTINQYMDRHNGNVFAASGIKPESATLESEASAFSC